MKKGMTCEYCGTVLTSGNSGWLPDGSDDGHRYHIFSRCIADLVTQRDRLRVVVDIAAHTMSGMGGTFAHPQPGTPNVLALEMALHRYRAGMPAVIIAESERECGVQSGENAV